jgi:hypothetical protein
MRADELCGVFVAKAADRFRIGVVQVVVGAGVEIHVEIFGCDQYRHAPGEIYTEAPEILGDTIGEIKIRAEKRPLRCLEDEPVLTQPPDADGLFGNRKIANFPHQM